MVGRHLIKSWSRQQKTIALSSAEAELYAANLCVQQGIGIQTMFREMNLPLELILYVDASAAIGILSRRGLGKVRHIDANDLWLQQHIAECGVNIQKVDSRLNLADIGTKPLDAASSQFLLESMGFEIPEGS